MLLKMKFFFFFFFKSTKFIRDITRKEVVIFIRNTSTILKIVKTNLLLSHKRSLYFVPLFCLFLAFFSFFFTVFEADVEENDEYQKIYQEYKNLVDLLLGCFMEDMGITPEQFEYACTVNKYTKMPIQFQQVSQRDSWTQDRKSHTMYINFDTCFRTCSSKYGQRTSTRYSKEWWFKRI